MFADDIIIIIIASKMYLYQAEKGLYIYQPFHLVEKSSGNRLDDLLKFSSSLTFHEKVVL